MSFALFVVLSVITYEESIYVLRECRIGHPNAEMSHKSNKNEFQLVDFALKYVFQ